MSNPSDSSEEFVPFLSLRSLQDTYRALRRRRSSEENSPQFWDEVQIFLQRGEALGAYLNNDEERQTAQSRLDYWHLEVIKRGVQPPEAILADFDIALQPELPDDRCPYVGLGPFTESDAHLFYGRRQLTEQLIKTLTLSRLITVIGASGSGKSSLVLAGLLPRLRQGALTNGSKGKEASWRIYGPIVPGSAPLSNLAQSLKPDDVSLATWIADQTTGFQRSEFHLTELIRDGGEETAVIVIDQFEETFTLCRDLAERNAFISNLLQLVRTRDSNHIVILTMRSDYESYVNKAPLFEALYGQGIVRVSAMKAGEMREAIEEPAEQVGLYFEDGLVDELLREIVGEPAVLPLLQFTLMQLWENRERNYVTWDTYRRLGSSVLQALENTADNLYKSLPVEEQETARRIFLRLVWPTDGVENTRNRVRRRTLYLSGEASDRVNRVLDKLIQARLIHLTTGLRPEDDQVEVAHEALVRNWRRLIAWLEDERSQLRQRQRLALEAQKWNSLQQDPAALLRGTLLREALTYKDLNELETEYVQTSLQVIEQQRQAEEERREQTLRRRTRFIVTLTLTTVIALLAALFAFSSRQNAVESAAMAERSQATAVYAESVARQEAELLATAEAELIEQKATAEANALAAEASAGEADNARATAVANEASAEDARATAEAIAEALQDALEKAEDNAIEAENNAREAELATENAQEQSNLATARELAAIANDQLDSDPQLGLLLAIEAVNLTQAGAVPAEAEETLYRALQASQLEVILSGHTDAITAVSFSPDGTRLATASLDQQVKIWDTASGQELLTLEEHGRAVNSVAFSPDGRLLASGSDDGTTILWNAETGERQRVLGGSGAAILSVAFAPNGRLLVTTDSDRSVRVWDVVRSRSLFHQFVHTGLVHDIAFNQSGSRFATVGDDGRILLWDTNSGNVAVALPRQLDDAGNPIPLTSVAFSPDETMLVVADNQGIAQVWDVFNGRLRFTLNGHVSAIESVAYSQDGRFLATASSDRTAKVWDAETGQTLYTLSGHQGGVTAVAFNSDSSQIATASQDTTARLWQTEPGAPNLILTDHVNAVMDAAFSRDGKLVATASEDQTAKIWDLERGSVIHTLSSHNQGVNGVAFSPDGQLVATASEDWVARVWDTASGMLQFPTLNHRGPVNAIAFDAEGNQLATGSADTFARIWQLPIESNSAEIWLQHETAVLSVAFDPDGVYLAAGLGNGDIVIWDLRTQSIVTTLQEHEGPIHSLAFNPDGTKLASASNDATAKIWDVAQGSVIRTFSGHAGAVRGVAFSPDGSQVATASVDRTVKVWRADNGQTIRTLLGHTSTVFSVDFSPDGTQLVTAGFDRTAQVTELTALEALFAEALAQVKRPLTAVECAQYLHGLPCRLVEE
ncbi:MAG: hypothetical protein AAF614_13720 [Chloroflexota bacterium]